jgi:hypothetical protein
MLEREGIADHADSLEPVHVGGRQRLLDVICAADLTQPSERKPSANGWGSPGGVPPRYPTRAGQLACCASAASGAARRLALAVWRKVRRNEHATRLVEPRSYPAGVLQ